MPSTEQPVPLAEASAKPGIPYTNGLAVASLVLGIVALIGPAVALMIPLLILLVPTPLTVFTAVPAVVLGHIALRRIRLSAGKMTGTGLAIAGLVTGYVGIVLMGLAIVYAEFILPAQQREMEETLVQQQRKMEDELKHMVIDPMKSLPTKPPKAPSPPRPRQKTSKPDKGEIALQDALVTRTNRTIKANESGVLQDLKAIIAAQAEFHSANGCYAGSLKSLTSATPPLLSGNWSGARNGYSFSLMASGDFYRVNATPVVPGQTGRRSFFTDTSGVIRCNSEGSADKNSPPLNE